MRLKACLLALCLAVPSPAFATGEILNIITPHDSLRLLNFSDAKDRAVTAARNGGSRDDIALMDTVLSARHQSFQDFDMTGNWQCRTIKLGGLAELVVYSWFRCRVTDDGSGWRLEKLTGSQRTTGRFFTDSDTRLIYLGAGTVNDEKPLPYGSGPDSDQVGYAFRNGHNHWQIEFPSPARESTLDILQFRR